MRSFLGALSASAIVLLAVPPHAVAQSGSIHLKSTMKLVFDCETPWRLKNYGVTGRLSATLNPDRTASADLRMSGFMFAGEVRFDGLGRGVSEAPGGTSQLRVVGPNRLRGIWSLPNNDMILDIVAREKSCEVNLTLKLKPGKTQYSMFGGSKFYYCSSARLVQTSCEAK